MPDLDVSTIREFCISETLGLEFEDGGDQYYTQGVVARKKEYVDENTDRYIGILHCDEAPVLGHGERIFFLAQELADELGENVSAASVSFTGGRATTKYPKKRGPDKYSEDKKTLKEVRDTLDAFQNAITSASLSLHGTLSIDTGMLEDFWFALGCAEEDLEENEK